MALLNLPYWNRLWIIQEIAMSPSLCFLYGPHFIKPSEIWCLAKTLRKASPATKHEAFRCTDVRTINNTGRSITTVVNFRLISEFIDDPDSTRHRRWMMRIVDQARRSCATDARGKVYGILALLPSQISSQVHASYSPAWTWQKAWIRFSRICLEYDKRLDLIGICASPRPKTTGLATWAVDLTTVALPTENSSHELKTFEFRYGDAAAMMFEESLPTNFISFADRGLDSSYYFSQDEQFLHCVAVFIDAVREVATRADHGEPSAESFLNSDLASGHALTTE